MSSIKILIPVIIIVLLIIIVINKYSANRILVNNDINKEKAQIIGTYRLQKSENKNILPEGASSVIMQLTQDNRLIYTIQYPEKKQITNLVYYLKNGVIITDQPSAPKEETTKYYFESRDTLILEKDELKSWFDRIN